LNAEAFGEPAECKTVEAILIEHGKSVRHDAGSIKGHEKSVALPA
jgi:hypothetical protein